VTLRKDGLTRSEHLHYAARAGRTAKEYIRRSRILGDHDGGIAGLMAKVAASHAKDAMALDHDAMVTENGRGQ
jgi:hypothetical protein